MIRSEGFLSTENRRSILKTGLGVLSSVLGLERAAAAGPSELRIGLASKPSSLDPHFAALSPNIAVASHMFETLVGVDESGRLIPALARAWIQLDATTFEFEIRRDVKFHDGSPLRISDIVYSLQRPAAIKNSPGPYTAFTRTIKTFEAVSEYILRIKTTIPYLPLPIDLSQLFIVSKKALIGAGSDDFDSGKFCIGTGPYKFHSYDSSSQISLLANPEYWGQKPNFSQVTIRFLPSAAARLSALTRSDVDMIEVVPPSEIQKLKQEGVFEVRQKPVWRAFLLHLNHSASMNSGLFLDATGLPLSKNPLKDIRVREALSISINRKDIVNRILNGSAYPSSQLISFGLLGHDYEMNADPYDPERALKLLAEAGYPHGFSMVLGAPNDRYFKDAEIATSIASMWAEIKIKPRLKLMPMAEYLPDMKKGNFGAAFLGWGALSGDLALRALLGSVDPDKGWGAWNWGKYSNEKVDKKIMAAFSSNNTSTRHTHSKEAMQLAVQDYASLPLYYQVSNWAFKRNLAYRGRIDEFTLAQEVSEK